MLARARTNILEAVGNTPLVKLADTRIAIVREGTRLLDVITKFDLIEYLAKKHGGR